MYPIDGKNPITGEAATEYPSVTTIIGLENKPFLIQAAVDVAVDYIEKNLQSICYFEGMTRQEIIEFLIPSRTEYRRKWNEAALFGTKVHAIAERYFSQKLKYPDKIAMYYENDPNVSYTKEHRINGETEFSDHNLIWDDLFRKLYKGLHDWCKKNKAMPISMEEVLYGDGYAGRYDLVCTLNGTVTMIDIKTGKGSYYNSWKPQLAAYRKAYNFKRRHASFRKGDVEAHSFLKWNKATEKWNYKDFSDDYEIDYKIFTTLLEQWWYKQIKKNAKKLKGN